VGGYASQAHFYRKFLTIKLPYFRGKRVLSGRPGCRSLCLDDDEDGGAPQALEHLPWHLPWRALVRRVGHGRTGDREAAARVLRSRLVHLPAAAAEAAAVSRPPCRLTNLLCGADYSPSNAQAVVVGAGAVELLTAMAASAAAVVERAAAAR
jgi:hypothetical protein